MISNRQLQTWAAKGYLHRYGRPIKVGSGSKIVDRLAVNEQQHLTLMVELVELGFTPKAAAEHGWKILAASVAVAANSTKDPLPSPFIGLGKQYVLQRCHGGHPLRGLRHEAFALHDGGVTA